MRQDAGRVTTILTYHRIVPDGARESFHDIEVTRFEQQLRCLVDRTAVAQDGARLIPGRGPLCLTFDDGTGDHRRVADLLRSFGLTGTFFVITGRLGTPKYLSEDDVRAMAAHGHRIGSHGVTHRHLAAMTAAELDEELVTSRRHLEALTHGTVDWIAPPGGVYSEAVVEAACQVGYKVFRTMDWGYAGLPLDGRVPCLPIVAHYDIGMFIRLLEGKAPLWISTMKNLIKRGVGPALYTKIRNFNDKYLVH